ncbi:MAG TPA: glucoamylase family protein, partial [Steroidobacteraceae bacterium]|nr:glucoamylase family protein [Steroidobacteraceae bacterium]
MLGQRLRRAFGFASAASPWDTPGIIRAELFSVERLEQHAQSLAEAQVVTLRARGRHSFNGRMRENEAVLLSSYRAVAAALDEGRSITPAAEWLIDNYHLVEEQIRQVRDDLPPRFSRQLPQLESGPFSGYPRIFGMAWACIAHSDSCLEPETLRRFMCAYQRVQPLTIGELWAFAIMLRIVLVENLRRAAVKIVSSRLAREEADQIADELLGVNGMKGDPNALIRRHERSANLSDAFVVQMIKRLRDQDPGVMPALTWLEDLLASQGTTSERIVHQEHQRQGAANATVRNIITSMRLLSEVDWPDFVEAVSLIDEVLGSAGSFAQADFTTRNLYRSAVEDLARGSAHSELDIARAAVAAARAGDDDSERMRDPGYHLISRGRRAFERSVGYRAPARQWPSRCNAAIGPGGYISAIFLIAALVLTAPLLLLHAHGIAGAPMAWLALLGIVPAMDLAVALVNRTVTRGFGTTVLPALALRDGVPTHLKTIVVVPMLLTTARALEAQIQRLEVHYLASGDGAVHFALLSDWTDASTADAEGDDALLDVAAAGIAQLNRRHPAVGDGERFLLLHRNRVWSVGQRQWMGWERKRGKLHELNRLLRGASDTTFVAVGGQVPRVPPDVRYVVTLDADTRLPRGTVQRLVGKLAHPLNRPLIEAATGRIVEGYAVLQPRITPSLPIGREGSLFQRVFSSVAGIDPYDAAVSDVYQDLFGAGSYAGKGIYDVDAFEAALGDRVPEGSLLSHDLFEGTFARAGLASDVEIVEDFPSRYDVAAARAHRWARGDWQLLPWILGRGDAARRRRGPLPLIGLWKMLDNLRRTLSAPTCVLALLGGWLLPLHAALVWTTFVLTTIALPAMLPLLAAFTRRPQRITLRSRIRTLGQALRLAILQVVLITAFLAHQAWLMTDAIGRTLFRLLVSRRNLLEWVTAAQMQHSARPGLAGMYRRMNGSVLIALAALVVVGFVGRGGGWEATPFVMLWLLAPAIARWISVPPAAARRQSIAPVDARALRLIARRTWRYFETFVTAEDHMLPPDNFQESPRPVLAHRTSPTNLGLYLLATVTARDFGWAGAKETVERLEATLATMQRMQRYRGHFYNWYDTRDLRALEPRYVSSVDSGNLAAHLLTVANACRGSLGTPVDDSVAIAGVEDALCLMREALDRLPDDRFTQTVTHHQLDDALAAVLAALHDPQMKTGISAARLTDLSELAAILDDDAQALAGDAGDEPYDDLRYWAAATHRSIESWRSDFIDSDPAQCELDRRVLAIETAARTMAEAMEFDFLLDRERQLLSIGYRAGEGVLDPSCYDLLASEARLASFFAIGKNDVPARHWFRLGRAVTPIGHGAALISWSGSMFEYLMPSLVMRAPAGSLLEQTNRLIVQRQRSYADSLGVPWGVSESAYNARDLELTYQYSNFGVPGLGLKRGLSENVVIAPYATALAAMVDPAAAVRNYARLADLGVCGRYGFYEAVDYTRSRL